MLLYHFTSRANLRSILQGGLNRGAVATSTSARLNPVWLTSDSGLDGHGLETGGTFMSDSERREAYEWSGTLPPPGTRFPKTGDVRITVDVDSADRNLQEWLPWARRRLAPDWLAQLHPIAGGTLRKAKTWRLYFGTIPPEAFVAVEQIGPGSQRQMRLAKAS